jgi:hypothetical protein
MQERVGEKEDDGKCDNAAGDAEVSEVELPTGAF